MTLENLEKAIEQAFQRGDNQYGLELLREVNSNVDLANPASTNRQALVEEQIGDWALAGKAHHQCILLAPHVASAYLYGGYWLEKSKRLDAAAALYSLAWEADPAILSQDNDPNSTRGIRTFSGLRCLLNFLTQHHADKMEQLGAPLRLINSKWLQTDANQALATSRPEKDYQPQLFYIPELNQLPYYNPALFNWTTCVQDSYETIKGEYLAAMRARAELRPYLEDTDGVPENLTDLAGSMHWSALDLFKHGRKNQDVIHLFPKTLRALETVPTYSAEDAEGNQPYEVFFSVLKPGQSISPHYGQSNHSLTVHLPIEIPDHCFLEVAGETHAWQEGELVIFDDNFLHSAHNKSEKTRIVLIFSIWHPDLSIAEQKLVQTAFAKRQEWMLARREKINQLIR